MIVHRFHETDEQKQDLGNISDRMSGARDLSLFAFPSHRKANMFPLIRDWA